MAHEVVELNCPGCGARVSTGQKECDWCHKPIVISTFNSVYSMPLPEVNKYAGAYRKALSENPDNTDLNKSVAMCYLKLKMYDKALAAFEKAIEDYFERKHFRTSPTYQEALQMAVDAGLSDYDIEQLFAILGVARPDCI